MALNSTYAADASVAINGSIFDEVSAANLAAVGTVSTGSDADGNYITISSANSNYLNLGVLPRITKDSGGTWIYKIKHTASNVSCVSGEFDEGTAYAEKVMLNQSGLNGTNISGVCGLYIRSGAGYDRAVDVDADINDGDAHIVGIEWTKNTDTVDIWIDGVKQTVTVGVGASGHPTPTAGDTDYPLFLFSRNLRGVSDQGGVAKVYSFIRLENSGFDLESLTTDMSPIFSAGADTTAPTLTSATATATGATTASGSVTTDEGNGTLYSVATTSDTKPIKAQVKAGQDHTGSAAVWDGSQAISSAGAKSVSVTGLTAETTYYLHHMHEDAATNQSDVVSSASFTTTGAFASTISVTDALKNNTGTVLASQSGIKVAVLKADDLESVYEATATTNASGILSDITNAAIVAGSYHVAIKLTDGSVGITGAIEAV